MTDKNDIDDSMTQRERRRQQFQKEKRSGPIVTPDRVRKIGIPLIIALIIAGIVAGMVANQAKADDCPGHWHSEFYTVVDGQRISYSHPSYDNAPRGTLPISYHMHQPNDHQIHWENLAVAQCERMGDFLEGVDTHLTDDRLVLDGGHAQLGQAGTYTENGDYKVQAYYTPTGDDADWQPISAADLLDRQPRNEERTLILVGEYTENEIKQWQTAVPTITA